VFDPAATKAGVPGLSPHELRHTCASLAIRSRASIKTVQRLLGHATATMTLDNYGHLYPDELDQVAQQMGAESVYPVRTGGVKTTSYVEVWTASIPVCTSPIARLAQRESASLTRKRSLVQSQYRAPESMQIRPYI
jgi:hypothetical protein